MQLIYHYTIITPRPHPTTGEYRSPPFGGDIKKQGASNSGVSGQEQDDAGQDDQGKKD
jgi:hypothetical protein